MKDLTHISLFAGIGGIDLAAQWAGFRTILFVEIDSFCQKVLKKHWSDVPIIGDIRDVTKEKVMAYTESWHPREQETRNGGQDIGGGSQEGSERSDASISPVTLITSGFPCQPVSVAGKRRGKEDDRWLWPDMLRVISEVRPAWVVAENVTGLLHMGFYDCLSDLEGEGYETIPFVVPACGVNAPHRRDRIFIVAHYEGCGLGQEFNKFASKILPEDRTPQEFEGSSGYVAHSECERWGGRHNGNERGGRRSLQTEGSSAGDKQKDVANTTGTRIRQQTQDLRQKESKKRKRGGQRLRNGISTGGADVPDPDNQGQQNREGSCQPTWSPGERAISGADWWAVEPELCMLANGLSEELDGDITNGRTINAGKEGTPFCWREVRRLWNGYLSRGSPHRWRQNQQLARKLADILQCLSYPMALAEWERTLEITLCYLHSMRQACEALGAMRNPSVTVDEAWQSLSEEEKDWVRMATSKGRFVAEWPGVPRVAKGIKNRVDRLKCLGNAVVPQQIYPILKAIADIESV